jgi:transposase InsO family protein
MANVAPCLAVAQCENKRPEMRPGSARSREAGDDHFLPPRRLDLEPVGCPRSRKAYDSVSAAREGIGSYLDLYNRRRPHSSLDDQTPDQAYFGHQSMPPIRLAA